MKLYTPFTFFWAFAAAVPVLEPAVSNQDELAKPFSNATAATPRSAVSGWSIFRRQGSCPSLTLLCPSGGCCSYDSSCCGDSCCASGYLCTGGTEAAPCCVAIGSSSNSCGAVNSNPCTVSGYLPCSNINLCCPPNSECYFDSYNVGRCAPLPSPTPIYSVTTPVYSTTTTSVSTTYYTTSSSTTPIPIPKTTPYSATPTPNDSSSSSSSYYTYGPIFWTPAAIGGVAGGSIAFLILVFIVICCCLRRQNGKYVYRFGPLSDGQIYWRVQDLETTASWQNFYTDEAKRIKGENVPDPCAWFEDFAARAIAQRILQLQNGGEYTLTTGFSGAVSIIPVIKYWAVPWSTRRFNDLAIEALGFGDTAEVNRLAKEASLKANPPKSMSEKVASLSKSGGQHLVKHVWMNSGLREHLKEGIKQYLTQELGQEATMHLAEELVHIKVGLGTFYSIGRGIYKSTIQKDNALEYLRGQALEMHLEVFVANALVEIFPEDSSKI